MHVENIREMIECLAGKAKAQLDGNIDCVDTKEMGECIDMIKDLAEAEYYSRIVTEMESGKEEEEILAKLGVNTELTRYYGGRRYYFDPAIHGGISRYYTGNGMGNMNGGTRRYTTNYPDMYDPANEFNNNKWRLNAPNERYKNESRYDLARRSYTEAKNHSSNSNEDEEVRIDSLDEYLKELSSDVTEMIQEATTDERSLMKSKLQGLINKL